MDSRTIRTKFFDFFIKHGHTKVPSSSLIPAQDPTLLFANAGMNQFKDVFLGLEKRSYTRAVSIQKCVRAGGKHNDLDNVGFTKRHLTFFEMMGNFSFGDYFKKEAISFAWSFLTKDLNLPTTNLYVSIYKTDEESYAIWNKEIGIPAHKIYRLGEAENFWSMGDLGPCGPCTEIHVDRGPSFGCADLENCGPACNCDRFLEIWNLVFMQFDRQESGEFKPLAQTGVDTGMGLERLSSIMQNVDSVFLTDLFAPIIAEIEKLTGITYKTQNEQTKAAFHVLCDHVRSTSLLIADGCAPSNDGRGYVLRKIIRRAALFEQKLTNTSIFPTLAKTFIRTMSDIYPELKINESLIISVLTSEIDKFAQNLIRGKQILDRYFAENAKTKVIDGHQAFKLYDTYGFPFELVALMAKERGFTVDEQGFSKEMSTQQEQSGKKTMTDPLDHIDLNASITTDFTGYQELETTSEIIALIDEKHEVKQTIPQGKSCWVLSKASPFFIVGGGQVPDQGWLVIGSHKAKIDEVRYINGRIAAKITAPTPLHVGDSIISIVDKTWRTNAMKNHTGTHMLQSALIQVLGNQVKQSGSLVHPDYLRFDFTYHRGLTPQEIKQVEDIVNDKIRENIPVNIQYTTYKQAIDNGALAFFGDKYNPEKVRMVKVADFSTELCGGTHVARTGDIGTFKITDESALSAGHRRIFAVTGPRAIDLFQDVFGDIKQLGHEFKVKTNEVAGAVLKQKDQLKDLQLQLRKAKKELLLAQLPLLQAQIKDVAGIPFLFCKLEDASHDDMKDLSAKLHDKKPGFYFLLNKHNGAYLFFATIAPEIGKRISLKELSIWLKDQFGLRGGGSATMIQGGADAVPNGFETEIVEWVKKQ